MRSSVGKNPFNPGDVDRHNNNRGDRQDDEGHVRGQLRRVCGAVPGWLHDGDRDDADDDEVDQEESAEEHTFSLIFFGGAFFHFELRVVKWSEYDQLSTSKCI